MAFRCGQNYTLGGSARKGNKEKKRLHTIRGIPQLKDVERFLNGSFHEFCRLKAFITLKQVNTSEE